MLSMYEFNELPNTSKILDSKDSKRMKVRDNRKRMRCYPEDALKSYWDLMISIVLIAACSITPYLIAFSRDSEQGW